VKSPMEKLVTYFAVGFAEEEIKKILDEITFANVEKHFTEEDEIDEHTLMLVIHRVRKIVRSHINDD
jgi:hypothetical protein